MPLKQARKAQRDFPKAMEAESKRQSGRRRALALEKQAETRRGQGGILEAFLSLMRGGRR